MTSNWTWITTGVVAALVAVAAFPAHSRADAAQPAATVGVIGSQQLAKIVPGRSTKTDIRSLLGAPWREVQFNDCGMAMDDQADETWEYRGTDSNGGYRIHIEFGDDNRVHLIAKIPDQVIGGKATDAKVAPTVPANGMSM
jgi:hypothetical protein